MSSPPSPQPQESVIPPEQKHISSEASGSDCSLEQCVRRRRTLGKCSKKLKAFKAIAEKEKRARTELDTDLESALQKLNVLAEKNELLEQKLVDQDSIIEELQQRCSTQDQQHAQASPPSQHQREQQQEAALQALMARHLSERRTLNQKLSTHAAQRQLHPAVSETTEQIHLDFQALGEQYLAALAEIASLTSSLASVQAQLSSAQLQVQKLRAEAQLASTQAERLRATIHSHQSEIQRQSQSAVSTAASDQQQQQLLQAQKRLSQLEKLLAERQRESTRLAALLEHRHARVQTLSEQLRIAESRTHSSASSVEQSNHTPLRSSSNLPPNQHRANSLTTRASLAPSVTVPKAEPTSRTAKSRKDINTLLVQLSNLASKLKDRDEDIDLLKEENSRLRKANASQNKQLFKLKKQQAIISFPSSSSSSSSLSLSSSSSASASSTSPPSAISRSNAGNSATSSSLQTHRTTNFTDPLVDQRPSPSAVDPARPPFTPSPETPTAAKARTPTVTASSSSFPRPLPRPTGATFTPNLAESEPYRPRVQTGFSPFQRKRILFTSSGGQSVDASPVSGSATTSTSSYLSSLATPSPTVSIRVKPRITSGLKSGSRKIVPVRKATRTSSSAAATSSAHSSSPSQSSSSSSSSSLSSSPTSSSSSSTTSSSSSPSSSLLPSSRLLAQHSSSSSSRRQLGPSGRPARKRPRSSSTSSSSSSSSSTSATLPVPQSLARPDHEVIVID